MNMGMRHFKSEYRNTHPFAGHSLFNGPGNLFGKYHHTGQHFIIQIKNIIGFLFGNHQGMPFGQRIDIEKGK